MVISLLIVFYQCYQCMIYCQVRIIQGMNEMGFFIGFVVVVSLYMMCLEILDVGVGGDFMISVLCWNLYFEVIGFVGVEVYIVGVQCDFMVWQVQQLQYFFGVIGYFFQCGYRVFWVDDLYYFNFIELVYMDQIVGVVVIGIGFRVEVWCMGGYFDWQIVFVDDFIVYQVGQWYFCCWDQCVVVVVSFFFQWMGMEQVVGEFWQLVSVIQGVLVYQVWDIVFVVVMLFGVQIQYELCQGVVQMGQLFFYYYEV